MFARDTINVMKRRVTKRIHITRRFRPAALTVVVGLFAIAGFIALRGSFAQTNQPLATTDAITPNDPRYDKQPFWKATGVDELWSKTTGSPDVTIALVGNGVNPHEEFEGRLLPGYDFQTNKPQATPDNDNNTYIAGYAAAKGNNGKGIAGACWNCKILPLTVFDSQVRSTNTIVGNAIRYAADANARVIVVDTKADNNDPNSDVNKPLRDAIQYANSKGSLIIGFIPYIVETQVAYPAAYPTVLTPTAVNADGSLTEYSRYPNYADLAIPAADLSPSTKYTGYSDYGNMSDHEVATGYTAGLAALLFSLYPKATQADMYSALKTTATPCCSSKIEGGIVNVPKAVAYLEAKYPTSTTPTPTPPTPTPPTPTPPTPTPPTPNPPSSGKAGDLNGDNKVNLTDLSLLLSSWGKADTKADLNKNGKVDLPDLSILLSNWGK